MKKILILSLSLFLLGQAPECFSMAKVINEFSTNPDAKANFKELYQIALKHLYYKEQQNFLTKLAQSIASERKNDVEKNSLIPLCALTIMTTEFVQKNSSNNPDEYFELYQLHQWAHFAQDQMSYNKKIEKRYKSLAYLCATHGIIPERIELLTFSVLLLELETVISSANRIIGSGKADNCHIELIKATCAYFMKEYADQYKTMALPPIDFMKSLGLSDDQIKELQN